MAQDTHDVGRLYFHGLRYPKPARQWPVVDRGASHEVEEPWRIGACAVVRLPFTRLAAVVGWWDRGRSYEEMVAEEEKVTLAWQQGAEAIRQYREAPWRA